jgi:hypothetical protein
MWKRTMVPIENLPMTIKNIEQAVKNGEKSLEKIRCVYILNDTPVVHSRMPWDFLDETQKQLSIKEFYLYRWEDK